MLKLRETIKKSLAFEWSPEGTDEIGTHRNGQKPAKHREQSEQKIGHELGSNSLKDQGKVLSFILEAMKDTESRSSEQRREMLRALKEKQVW